MKFLKTEEHFNMPICTVLLITYNHAEYIRKAIDSVLEQKTQYDFVIHIFDDERLEIGKNQVLCVT